MWHDCSRATSGAEPGGGLILDTVWHVKADRTYDVVRPKAAPRGLIAVRTLAGAGRFELDGGNSVRLGRQTLVVLENPCIRRYRTEEDLWHFWWFEFVTTGPLFFPLRQCLNVSGCPAETAGLREVFMCVRREPVAQRRLASAGLAHLMYRWLAGARDERRQSPYQERLDRVIELMRERTGTAWPVVEMARTARMGERRFRQVFTAVTGQSPKQFHDGLRLDLGRQILRAGPTKLADVAERLGYSSAFHFSRAFRHRFGRPPSWERGRDAHERRPAQAAGARP